MDNKQVNYDAKRKKIQKLISFFLVSFSVLSIVYYFLPFMKSVSDKTITISGLDMFLTVLGVKKDNPIGNALMTGNTSTIYAFLIGMGATLGAFFSLILGIGSIICIVGHRSIKQTFFLSILILVGMIASFVGSVLSLGKVYSLQLGVIMELVSAIIIFMASLSIKLTK
jgi:hypothetical protein